MEEFYTYRKTKNKNQINDRHSVAPKIISDTILLKDSDRALKATQTTRPFLAAELPARLEHVKK
jgi:hypothetical protein